MTEILDESVAPDHDHIRYCKYPVCGTDRALGIGGNNEAVFIGRDISLCVSQALLTVGLRYGPDYEPFVCEIPVVAQFLGVRKGHLARIAPCGPEIEQDNFAALVRELDGLSVERGEREVRAGLPIKKA